MKRIAHRGHGSPENSLFAIKKAQACGSFHYIEVDIQTGSDGCVFLFHDWTGARLLGNARPMSTYSKEEIRQTRLLHADGKPSQESIPFLEDALPLLNVFEQVNLEIKTQTEEASHAVLKELKRLKESMERERFVISSFCTDTVRLAKDAGFRTGLLYYGRPTVAMIEPVRHSFDQLHLSIEFNDAESLSELKRAFACPIWLYTERGAYERQRLEAMEADAVFTDLLP